MIQAEKTNKKLTRDFSEGGMMRLIKRLRIDEILSAVITIVVKGNVKRGTSPCRLLLKGKSDSNGVVLVVLNWDDVTELITSKTLLH